MSRRPATLVAAVLSAGLLSACGTGLHAQVYKETGRQDMASTNVGDVAVRNLHVEPPATGSVLAAGSTAVVRGVLVSNGDTEDSLTGASTDVAGSVQLQEGGSATSAIKVPLNGTSSPDWGIALSGLTKDLHVGQYISVTLVFEKGGRATLQIPVRTGDNGLENREPAQNPYGEGEQSGSEGTGTGSESGSTATPEPSATSSTG